MDLTRSDLAGFPVTFPLGRHRHITRPLACGSEVSEAFPASDVGASAIPLDGVPGSPLRSNSLAVR